MSGKYAMGSEELDWLHPVYKQISSQSMEEFLLKRYINRLENDLEFNYTPPQPGILLRLK